MRWIADKLDDLKIAIMICFTGCMMCFWLAIFVFVELCTAPRKTLTK